MKKIVFAAAALAILTAPALAENAKSGARTLNPFIGFSQGHSDFLVQPTSSRGYGNGASANTLSVGQVYTSPRQGRADKR